MVFSWLVRYSSVPAWYYAFLTDVAIFGKVAILPCDIRPSACHFDNDS